jgi:hypothetical protein
MNRRKRGGGHKTLPYGMCGGDGVGVNKRTQAGAPVGRKIAPPWMLAMIAWIQRRGALTVVAIDYQTRGRALR